MIFTDAVERARKRARLQGPLAPLPEHPPSRQSLPLACPSAPCNRAESVAFAVAGEGYLQQPLPVSDELLALAAPAHPAQVFRFSAPCEGSDCRHYDGSRCQLARRVRHGLPAVAEAVPACRIRANCRWHAEHGRDICLRCPQVVTQQVNPNLVQQGVALGPQRYLELTVQLW